MVGLGSNQSVQADQAEDDDDQPETAVNPDRFLRRYPVFQQAGAPDNSSRHSSEPENTPANDTAAVTKLPWAYRR